MAAEREDPRIAASLRATYRRDYTVDPTTGRITPAEWSPRRHANTARPNADTIGLEVGAIAPVEETTFANSNDGELRSLIDVKIMEREPGAVPPNQRMTPEEQFEELKHWLDVTHLKDRVILDDKVRFQLESLLSLNSKKMTKEKLKHIITHYIDPMLEEAQSGKLSKHIGLIGGARRKQSRKLKKRKTYHRRRCSATRRAGR